MFRIIFYLAANFIMTFIELPFEYTSGVELLCGYFITSIIQIMIDYTFYKIAYSYVDWYAALRDANSEEKGCLHWFIRLICAIMLYALTYVPVVSKCLTHIIHFFYTLVATKCTEYMQELLNIFIN